MRPIEGARSHHHYTKLCRFCERFQDFFGVAIRFDFGKQARDLAVRTNYKCCTFDAHHFLAVHVLFFNNTVGVGYFLVCIR
jgi:hypothetical protein